MYGREKKLSKPKTQNKINNIRNPFLLKRKKKKKKKLKVFQIFRHFLKQKEKNKRKKEIKEKKLMID